MEAYCRSEVDRSLRRMADLERTNAALQRENADMRHAIRTIERINEEHHDC